MLLSCTAKFIFFCIVEVLYVFFVTEPFTSYRIWVESLITGDSESDEVRSETLNTTTDVSGPGPPRITNVTCLPGGGLYIQWHSPIEFFNKIDVYTVVYRTKGEQPQEIRLDTTADYEKQSFVSHLTVFKYSF